MTTFAEDAYEAVKLYAETRSDLPFMAEDVRRWAVEQKLIDDAEEPRAWGGVLIRAAHAGLIEKAGYAPSGNARAHGRPTALWRAVFDA